MQNSIRKILIAQLLLFIALGVIGQSRLLSYKVSKCQSWINPYDYKSNYKAVWTNDSVLKINTNVSANCSEIIQARINNYGLIIDLELGNKSITNCECVYCIEWIIAGLKKNSTNIYLFNARTFDCDNKSLLDSLLKTYTIDPGNYRLINVVDRQGKKQGPHILKDKIEYYRDDILL